MPHFKKGYKNFSVMDAIQFVNEQTLSVNNNMDFGPGDHIEVSYKIIEGAAFFPLHLL